MYTCPHPDCKTIACEDNGCEMYTFFNAYYGKSAYVDFDFDKDDDVDDV